MVESFLLSFNENVTFEYFQKAWSERFHHIFILLHSAHARVEQNYREDIHSRTNFRTFKRIICTFIYELDGSDFTGRPTVHARFAQAYIVMKLGEKKLNISKWTWFGCIPVKSPVFNRSLLFFGLNFTCLLFFSLFFLSPVFLLFF